LDRINTHSWYNIECRSHFINTVLQYKNPDQTIYISNHPMNWFCVKLQITMISYDVCLFIGESLSGPIIYIPIFNLITKIFNAVLHGPMHNSELLFVNWLRRLIVFKCTIANYIKLIPYAHATDDEKISSNNEVYTNFLNVILFFNILLSFWLGKWSTGPYTVCHSFSFKWVFQVPTCAIIFSTKMNIDLLRK